jgi:hypothetical protein
MTFLIKPLKKKFVKIFCEAFLFNSLLNPYTQCLGI